MTSGNKGRKLRRKKTNKDNAMKGRGQPAPLQFNRNEQAIIVDLKQIQSRAILNQENIVKVNQGVQEAHEKINTIDAQMASYDATQMQPRFNTIEKKLDLLIDLILNNFDDIELSDEEIKLLELEEKEEEPTEKERDPEKTIPKAPPQKKKKEKKDGKSDKST